MNINYNNSNKSYNNIGEKMNETLLTKYLKRIILFLLIILSIFIIFKIYPFIKEVLKKILKLFLPFIISFSLAYILEPIVLLFQKIFKKRVIAVIVTLICFCSIIFAFFYLSIPLLVKEVNHLLENYDSIIMSIENAINQFASNFNFLPEDFKPTFNNLEIMLSDYFKAIDLNLIFEKTVDYLGIIVLIPMTTIYFMIDYNHIIERLKNYLITKNYLKFKDYLSELNKNIRVFVKTTFVIMLIMFTLATVSLFFAKSDYPLFFGLIIAVTNIIPYLGPYIGGAFPVLYALTESTTRSLLMLLIVFVVQLIESNIITPYLQGKKNDVHPILVILSLLVFGKIFGIIGMIIAVPLLTIIKVTIKYYPIKLKIKS